ncbi:MAG: potassium channel protein [Rhodospirillales bacterium]|nr:MAG: potassium channel protein [Rhodospirillales bacterium]
MAGTTGSQRVPFLVLRFMRRPILLLTMVYATSMIGWAVIPGPEQRPDPMGFFHSFYFLTYTATTTGFGELPHGFSEAQRMWAIVSLYAGVVAWLYALGAIIRLIQNRHFQAALAERRFARDVRRLAEPFVIVCGFGNRGSLLVRGLSDAGLAAVIIDRDPDRINAVHLRDYRIPTPALVSDARVPDRLAEAGLLRSNCRAVVALTDNEEVNAKVAVTACLLNPEARVVAQLTRDVHEETLATLGADIHLIDPFHTFARHLAATIRNPAVHMLYEWLVGAPNANLAMYADVPRGNWIVCGFGRMGHAMQDAFERLGIPVVVVDPNIAPDQAGPKVIAGHASQRTLKAAGIDRAAGIVAGTNSDADNLSIVLNARALNPGIFVIVRQNRHRNRALFDAAAADLIMQPTLVSARRVLFLLIAPLLKTFFEQVRESQVQARDAFLMDVITQLHDVVGGDVRPRLWTMRIGDETPAALARLRAEGCRITLADVLRDPAARDRRLPCVPLVLRAGDGWREVMPPLSHVLSAGDQVLLCGQEHVPHVLQATLENDYTLRYLMTGIDAPRGWVMQWLLRRFPRLQPAAAP